MGDFGVMSDPHISNSSYGMLGFLGTLLKYEAKWHDRYICNYAKTSMWHLGIKPLEERDLHHCRTRRNITRQIRCSLQVVSRGSCRSRLC